MPKSHCRLVTGSHSWVVDDPFRWGICSLVRPSPHHSLLPFTYPHFPHLVIHLTLQKFESITLIWSQRVSYSGDGRKVEANHFVLLFFI